MIQAVDCYTIIDGSYIIHRFTWWWVQNRQAIFFKVLKPVNVTTNFARYVKWQVCLCITFDIASITGLSL